MSAFPPVERPSVSAGEHCRFVFQRHRVMQSAMAKPLSFGRSETRSITAKPGFFDTNIYVFLTYPALLCSSEAKSGHTWNEENIKIIHII
jgi:hypothetical protein